MFKNFNHYVWVVTSLFVWLALLSQSARADEWALVNTTDFRPVVAQAKKDGLPIAIYFNRVRCGACEKLKEEAILPMINNGLLDGYVHMVEIKVNAKDEVFYDFYGEETDGLFFQDLYNITTFPSIVFVNAEGDEIGHRMENSGAYDYVPAELTDLINQALVALGKPPKMKVPGAE